MKICKKNNKMLFTLITATIRETKAIRCNSHPNAEIISEVEPYINSYDLACI